MMSNNKILTVSYGTFSCTLEGFDDSFGTMKAIAEYFRDLASEDRYFGAEPPQPDTEMLQRIAEREISRRVEAREHEGKIFLSAADTPDTATPEIAEAAPQVDHDAAKMVAEREAERAAQAEREAEAEMARVLAEAKEKAPDKAQDKARDRAQDRTQDEADHDTPDDAQPIYITDIDDTPEDADHDAAAADDVDLSAVMAHAQAIETDLTPRDLAAELPEASAFFANTQDDDIEIIDAEAEPVSQEPENNSIAAKLERIRAVVSQADVAADDADDYLEDEHADLPATAPVETSATADALADIEAALAADDLAEQETSAEVSEPEDDDVASILASLEAEDDDSPETNLFEDAQEKQDTAETAEEAAPAPRRVARVIKVKRADLEAAIEQGDLEEVDAPESTLSDEEEADLARELASVQAEQGDMAPQAMPGVDALPDIEDGQDDVSRLMAEADQHMDEEEGAKRRDAFAHLRAAVAAKKADTALGESDPEKAEGAYRDDLATAVKPRRPVAGGGRSERPDTAQRPAPLKLVAEQRVDAQTSDTPGPVRPRRVAATPELASTTEDSFAEFAEEMGANSLSDLLEAAAAYMSFVEGRAQFSRPQLMTKVRQVEKDDFSREDGLRSFGKLLRAGKIEKLKGGRFAATSDIGFRPDARAAG